MKKLILIVLIFAGCSKDKETIVTNNTNSFCWSCEVTRWTDGVQFQKDTCTKSNYAPQFKDENGNDENAICNRK